MSEPTTDDDKILAFDLQYAVCLQAVDEIVDALNELYTSIWLLTSGNDAATDDFYRKAYRSLLKAIADEANAFEITDEFRKQYETQQNAEN
ncbi:MAG: hypothetical protein WBD47_13655 [Phormidesmis sp.]